MNDLTDFNDTSDVSDAAIDWMARTLCYAPHWTPATVRIGADDGGSPERAIIIAARLIQAHRPELIVDPVDAIVAAEMEGDNYIAKGHFFETAKRLYLMGLEAGKASK